MAFSEILCAAPFFHPFSNSMVVDPSSSPSNEFAPATDNSFVFEYGMPLLTPRRCANREVGLPRDSLERSEIANGSRNA